MKLDIQTLMMLFFILFLILSIWKIWAFLPNEQLADDDTTPKAEAELIRLMLLVIEDKKGKIDEKELTKAMQNHPEFDKKLFWRFNRNRLKHLLATYYIDSVATNSIESIYDKLQT